MRKKFYNFAFVEDVLRDLPEIIRDRDILLSAAVSDAAFPSGGEAGSVQSSVRMFQQERFLLDRNRDLAEKLDEVVQAVVKGLGFLSAEDAEVVIELCFRGTKQEEAAEQFGVDARQLRRVKKRCCRALAETVSGVLPGVLRWRQWRGECQELSLRRYGL